MNIVNFCLICFQIWCIVKYIKKLKDTDERLKDNEIDYSDIKLQLTKFECYMKELDENNSFLKNKILNLEKELKKE